MLLEKFKRRVLETHGAFYVLEKTDGSNIIIDKKYLELFLCKMHFQAIIDCNYSHYNGFHIGQDGKIYERRTLNDAGIALYYKLHIWKKSYKTLKAVKEMNNNTNNNHLNNEKSRIQSLLLYSGFKNVYKYKGIECKNYNKENEKSL